MTNFHRLAEKIFIKLQVDDFDIYNDQKDSFIDSIESLLSEAFEKHDKEIDLGFSEAYAAGRAEGFIAGEAHAIPPTRAAAFEEAAKIVEIYTGPDAVSVMFCQSIAKAIRQAAKEIK